MEFKYVSANEGRLVARFGTSSFIGAVLVAGEGAKIDPKEVVAIPLQEWNRYPREYGRAMRNGDLKERSESEHKAWLQEQERVANEEAKKAAQEAKKEAPEEAKDKSKKSSTTKAEEHEQ